jgi:hypothetical protein
MITIEKKDPQKNNIDRVSACTLPKSDKITQDWKKRNDLEDV